MINIDKNFLKYLILPKGIQSIIYKLYVYLIPFLISLGIERENHLRDFFIFVSIFALFEIIINPVRYQLNDIKDFKEDIQRGNRWIKPVSEKNKKTILFFIFFRFFIGAAVAFFVNPKLLILAVLFVVLQLLYDYLFKPRMPIISIISISVAYPLRFLTIFFGLNIAVSFPYFILITAIFFYAFYMAAQWRRQESIFILGNGLVKKPFATYFSGEAIVLFINFSLIMFLLFMIWSVSNLMNINNLMASGIILTCTISGLFFRQERLKKLNNQLHNIIAINIFSLLTKNNYLIVLATSLSLTYLLLWYNDFYVNNFAVKYFSEKHYDETRIN